MDMVPGTIERRQHFDGLPVVELLWRQRYSRFSTPEILSSRQPPDREPTPATDRRNMNQKRCHWCACDKTHFCKEMQFQTRIWCNVASVSRTGLPPGLTGVKHLMSPLLSGAWPKRLVHHAADLGGAKSCETIKFGVWDMLQYSLETAVPLTTGSSNPAPPVFFFLIPNS